MTSESEEKCPVCTRTHGYIEIDSEPRIRIWLCESLRSDSVILVDGTRAVAARLVK